MTTGFSLPFDRTPNLFCLIGKELNYLDLKESNSGCHHHHLLSPHQIFIEHPLSVKHVTVYMLRKHILLCKGRHSLKDESKQMGIPNFQSLIRAQRRQVSLGYIERASYKVCTWTHLCAQLLFL